MGGDLHYKRGPPFCLGGTQFRLLIDFCVSQGAAPSSSNNSFLFFTTIKIILYYSLKLILVDAHLLPHSLPLSFTKYIYLFVWVRGCNLYIHKIYVTYNVYTFNTILNKGVSCKHLDC